VKPKRLEEYTHDELIDLFNKNEFFEATAKLMVTSVECSADLENWGCIVYKFEFNVVGVTKEINET